MERFEFCSASWVDLAREYIEAQCADLDGSDMRPPSVSASPTHLVSSPRRATMSLGGIASRTARWTWATA